ncbi:cobalt transporter CbiM [Sansalvadorimonas verongulae]|uniref:cobalt transporter CbiM n=1 Tax=Sansalvadorimonas verongulae TaxID=2172824 RepID=UPI0012BC4AB6|nr:cobalt transporter CbiM [Sansalvadorimonas verongulae]MTI12600.1 cobalt transporter CbiM [Sansalvadorimonas verongulae]
MHIVDGVLSAPVLIAGAAVSAAGCATGLKQMTEEKLPQTAVLAAMFFIASLIHVPVGPSSVHMVFTGLLGLVLGWLAFPAILTGLILQALFFGFGGLFVLGVNVMNIALPAVITGHLLRPLLKNCSRKKASVVGFAAGVLSLGLTTLMVATSLALSGDEFITGAKAVFLAHIPIMVIEGVLSAFATSMLYQVRPSVLGLKAV